MTDVYTVSAYMLCGIMGLCVGSFLNVVIYRVPENMSLAYPPSHCPKCDSRIKWYDNIPVLSWIILGGKCRNCKESISPRYMAVELLNGVLWLLCLTLFGKGSVCYALIAMAVCSVFICVAFIDLEHYLIFDRFQIILLLLGIACVFITPQGYAGDGLFKNAIDHVAGGIAGFLTFLLIGALVSRMKQTDALGGGDVKLAGVCGLVLGWQKLLLGVLVSCLAMLLIIALVKRKDEKNKQYPFAPFLTFGFGLSLLIGDNIISAYMSLITGV